MTQSLFILGRQPALGLAELESLYGAGALKLVGHNAALLDIAPKDIDFNRLGGSVKLCTLLNILDTTSWHDIEKYLSKMIPEHLQYVPEGKFKLGLSSYGLRVSPREMNATALRLKKIIKAAGRSVRVIPNKTAELNSAQVLHNQLTSPLGWELVCLRNGNRTMLGLTVAEQDIEAYSSRDQNRPMRDAKVGMLPPKLAQIIVNLAASRAQGSEQRAQSDKITVLDPFCGTGVVLQEALLMGYSVYGTDLEPRMIEYSRGNLDWLVKKHSGDFTIQIESGDATKHHWALSPEPSALSVASEIYLGKPLSRIPEPLLLQKLMAECDRIFAGFLSNIGKQLSKNARLCLAVPAWRTKNGFKHLPTLDKLQDLGYTRLSFVHTSVKELLYYREDQYVARELIVLSKR